MAKKGQLRLDEILTLMAAQTQTEYFGGTQNWKLSFKQASAQHGS
jgi:hypothetical protein